MVIYGRMSHIANVPLVAMEEKKIIIQRISHEIKMISDATMSTENLAQ